jgi:hypothetical protein
MNSPEPNLANDQATKIRDEQRETALKDQLPARTSDLLVVWHATHDLVSNGEEVKGVRAN